VKKLKLIGYPMQVREASRCCAVWPAVGS
jgi:hypothetical protein